MNELALKGGATAGSHRQLFLPRVEQQTAYSLFKNGLKFKV